MFERNTPQPLRGWGWFQKTPTDIQRKTLESIMNPPSNFGFNVHNHLKGLEVCELAQITQADRLPFSVCVLNLEHDLNIGNTIRSAHLLGAERVIIIGRTKVDTRGCVGAQNYTTVQKVKLEDRDLNAVFQDTMQAHDLTPVFMEYTSTSRPLSSIEHCLPRRPCLVFGNEGLGIPDDLMHGHLQIHIPQRGVIRSFNVASAAAIIMYQVASCLNA